eukprot:CAMPEP_0184502190 /NCGR_PEP_ID=MMETSP0113_2-20130426/49596_1 /TAXON_ID=91329 /ORGANISM="Norrisiella sphaerica, Strain BC52" /LENGTH=75 /DNA_ID=CAMNT_0026891237 /DNA_START=240 /DNA_END=467 /DNA_ORIENTATION=+
MAPQVTRGVDDVIDPGEVNPDDSVIPGDSAPGVRGAERLGIWVLRHGGGDVASEPKRESTCVRVPLLFVGVGVSW